MWPQGVHRGRFSASNGLFPQIMRLSDELSSVRKVGDWPWATFRRPHLKGQFGSFWLHANFVAYLLTKYVHLMFQEIRPKKAKIKSLNNEFRSSFSHWTFGMFTVTSPLLFEYVCIYAYIYIYYHFFMEGLVDHQAIADSAGINGRYPRGFCFFFCARRARKTAARE